MEESTGRLIEKSIYIGGIILGALMIGYAYGNSTSPLLVVIGGLFVIIALFQWSQ